LQLIETHTFGNGVVMLRYERRPSRPAGSDPSGPVPRSTGSGWRSAPMTSDVSGWAGRAPCLPPCRDGPRVFWAGRSSPITSNRIRG